MHAQQLGLVHPGHGTRRGAAVTVVERALRPRHRHSGQQLGDHAQVGADLEAHQVAAPVHGVRLAAGQVAVVAAAPQRHRGGTPAARSRRPPRAPARSRRRAAAPGPRGRCPVAALRPRAAGAGSGRRESSRALRPRRCPRQRPGAGIGNAVADRRQGAGLHRRRRVGQQRPADPPVPRLVSERRGKVACRRGGQVARGVARQVPASAPPLPPRPNSSPSPSRPPGPAQPASGSRCCRLP